MACVIVWQSGGMALMTLCVSSKLCGIVCRLLLVVGQHPNDVLEEQDGAVLGVSWPLPSALHFLQTVTEMECVEKHGKAWI